MANGKPGRPRKERPIADPTPLRDVEQVMAAVERDAAPALETHPSDREASREARSESRQGSGRKRRKPLGVPVQRLQADVPSGMTGRWMNDTPGRIQRAMEAGYEFISSDGEVVQNREGCRSEIVGTGRDGGAMKAFLMAIPTVLYEEDQAAKMSEVDKIDEAIRRGAPQQAAAQDQGSFYTPAEGINYRPNTSAER